MEVVYLIVGLIVRELQKLVDGPALRQELRRRGNLLGRSLGLGLGLGRRALGRGGHGRGVVVGVVAGAVVGIGAGGDGPAEADADAGGEVALVVPGERPGDVDGLVAVAAEERPVLDAEDEGRLLLAHVAARELAGAERVQGKPLVLAGQPVGCVDLDVAAPAQRRLVGAAHHRRRRDPARVALDLHTLG